ncbi:MAG: AAA family ATPase, partial [Pseudanabaena sp.]
LWIDEIDKAFSGIEGRGDSGTTNRVFGTFLTWMAEKTSPVFVVATASNIRALPPEILRYGRVDAVFFLVCGCGGGVVPPTTSTQCVSPNVLTLAVIHHGVAFPLVWMMLDKKVTPTPKSFVNYGIVS